MCSWKKSLRIEKPRSPGNVGGARRPLYLGDNWNGTRGPPLIYALLATGNQSDEYCKPRSEDTREIGKCRVDYGPPGSSNDCHPSKHGRDLLLAFNSRVPWVPVAQIGRILAALSAAIPLKNRQDLLLVRP